MPELPFPVGQKVICVHDYFAAAVFEVFDATPKAGQVYTIREVFWAKEHLTRRDMLSVRLVELPPIDPDYGGFSLWRFRLLEDEKLLRAARRSQLKHVDDLSHAKQAGGKPAQLTQSNSRISV
ncbi:MAG: hypothetical protein NTX35_12695 [Verrucomicrobia bacterium]|nr:hypothetical protein [Verrucomicrobiota bacterium]